MKIYLKDLANIADEKVIDHIEHTVIGDASDDQILILCQVTVLLVKGSTVYFFHAATMICHQHSPLNIRRDLHNVKIGQIHRNNIEFRTLVA